MAVCAQASFSQRATWPPSAAVRQRSIALITFSWSRLTCPRLASRQAGPWSRKISATSTVGRPTSAALTPPVRAYALFLGRWCVPPSCASGLSMAAIRPVATRV